MLTAMLVKLSPFTFSVFVILGDALESKRLNKLEVPESEDMRVLVRSI